MVAFDEAFRRQLHELFVWRRDVRRFRRDPLPQGAIERLIETVCLSPSVGLSQPWRLVIVEDPSRRRAVIEDFKACNAEALRSYSGDRASQYATLKLAGLEEAPGHLAVFADKASQTGHGLGRMTMPEMIEYSVVAAICSMWLAARAEGIGLGWVSILKSRAHQRNPRSASVVEVHRISLPRLSGDGRRPAGPGTREVGMPARSGSIHDATLAARTRSIRNRIRSCGTAADGGPQRGRSRPAAQTPRRSERSADASARVASPARSHQHCRKSHCCSNTRRCGWDRQRSRHHARHDALCR